MATLMCSKARHHLWGMWGKPQEAELAYTCLGEMKYDKNVYQSRECEICGIVETRFVFALPSKVR